MDKLEINHQRGVSILKIQGDIEGDDGFHLLEIVQSSEDGALPFWLLDVPETNFVDSIALEVFLRISKILKERKGDLFISAPTPELKEILKITRLENKFKVYKSAEEALAKIYQVQPGEKK